jgi:Zn finger protein HypA/HybF involved in hydrogenase expression
MNITNTPTTFEISGLLTKQDIEDRYKVMRQCRKCSNWTQQNMQEEYNRPCTNCGITDFDATSTKSLRTFNILTDKKRRVR